MTDDRRLARRERTATHSVRMASVDDGRSEPPQQDGDYAELATALKLAFPDVDFGSLANCATTLRQSWKLRGAAAHDSVKESYDEVRDSTHLLWTVAVGSQAAPGLISRLCGALGAGPAGMRSHD